MDREAAWKELSERARRLVQLQEVRELLEWDQMSCMPPAGAEARGEQAALLAGLHHRWISDPALGELLEALSDPPEEDPVRRAAARNLSRAYRRATRLPAELVEALERARSAGHRAWLAAREARDFQLFRPALEELVRLAREQSAALSEPGDHPYDALLEDYEPGERVARLRPLFERLEAELRELVQAAAGRPAAEHPPGDWPEEAQERLVRRVVEALGFDFRAGRLDRSVHPFTSGLHPTDVRITTRYRRDHLASALYAAIHEAGHGMYEQGLPLELVYTGAGSAASMGLHESQSRFWENAIGGSLPFLRWLAGVAREFFPEQPLDPEALYRYRNRIAPGLNRVEADEATYNLHVLVRFRLELALLEGSLRVAELEEAWNEAYERALGLRPQDPVEGVLQDVHWSEGLFGYFPTYTLGNLYAASLLAAVEAELPGLWEAVERGDFAPVLGWLRERVHRRASLATAAEIVRDAVGERDPVEDLVSHLWSRHGALAGLRRPAH